MFKDKYTSIFSHQMEAIVFIILQIFFCSARQNVYFSVFSAGYDFMNKQVCFFFCSNSKMLSHLENWGNITGYYPVLAGT